MSKARRKWEQDLIATAALMGAVFEEIVVSRRFWGGSGEVSERVRKAWAVSIHDSEQRGVFSSPHQAAYWYLVERHNLSFQNNGELMPCQRYGGMMNSDSCIRRHQSLTKEAAWRKEQKLSSKFRRNIALGHTVKALSPTDT